MAKLSVGTKVLSCSFGYTAQEVIGKPVPILMPKDRVDELAQSMEKIAKGEPVGHYETKRLKKDGTILDVSISLSPIREGTGKVFGAAVIARDITGAQSILFYMLRSLLKPVLIIGHH